MKQKEEEFQLLDSKESVGLISEQLLQKSTTAPPKLFLSDFWASSANTNGLEKSGEEERNETLNNQSP